MRWIVNFGRFWYDFIVGDDWTIAVGVVIAVAATAAVAHAGITAWPILPLVVVVGLAWSIARVARTRA
ncbi:MAG TPA: hypothetical protein VGP92_16810 [Acidimicrobiia bacterium]|jgi:hypothetical protein|nr:hypothetical protein [Acidimicrobiia bacterium]